MSPRDYRSRDEEPGLRLQATLDAERELLAQAEAPLAPEERADPEFQRLERAAERASDELRARVIRTGGRPASLRRWWPALVAAAAVVIVSLVSLPGPDAPPRDDVLGPGAELPLPATVSLRDARLSWPAVPGAASYDVRITDADGAVLLERPATNAGSTTWPLTDAQTETLQRAGAKGPVRLTVEARDGSGLRVGRGTVTLRIE